MIQYIFAFGLCLIGWDNDNMIMVTIGFFWVSHLALKETGVYKLLDEIEDRMK